MALTPNETELLSAFIDELLERFSCDGCNDYSLPDTPGNQHLFILGRKREEPGLDAEEYAPMISDGQIHCSNSTILRELKFRMLRNED